MMNNCSNDRYNSFTILYTWGISKSSGKVHHGEVDSLSFPNLDVPWAVHCTKTMILSNNTGYPPTVPIQHQVPVPLAIMPCAVRNYNKRK